MQANIRFNNLANAPETDVKHYLPCCLLASALVNWFGFQLMQNTQNARWLDQRIQQPGDPVSDCKKMEDSLSALATGTKELANLGNSQCRPDSQSVDTAWHQHFRSEGSAMQPAKKGNHYSHQK